MSEKTILLDHGSGGLASQELISELFLAHLNDPVLHHLEDSAILDNSSGRLAFTTDSYVVDPIFFPGGDIGKLAVHGTINDLAMRGAIPRYLSLGLILEEGLGFKELERVIRSIAEASKEAGVPVVTGDTKVVPRGKGDKIFINTSGIGFVPDGLQIASNLAQLGDAILISGTIADHGITIMTRRAGISVSGNLQSDTMALHHLVARLLENFPQAVRSLRDPTRGGVATVLNEIAGASGYGIRLDSDALPVRSEVRAACELLGLEPLYLANEGKCIMIVDAAIADQALELLRGLPEGRDAARIGEIVKERPGQVVINTPVGGTRMVAPLHGAPLPRIC